VRPEGLGEMKQFIQLNGFEPENFMAGNKQKNVGGKL
jgi:hypothetical protein